jgi:hypothetical protein
LDDFLDLQTYHCGRCFAPSGILSRAICGYKRTWCW